MIAFEELAAALERWRIRNGLPGTPPLFADGARKPAATTTPAPMSFAPPAPVSFAPPAAPPPAVARPAPPAPPPVAPAAPPSAETFDEDLAEADVLDEEHLDTDGPDFAMSFSAPPGGRPPQPPAPIRSGLTADEQREAALLGSTDPGIVPLPVDDEDDGDDVWPEAASYASSTPAEGGRAPATVVDDDDDDDGGTLVNG